MFRPLPKSRDTNSDVEVRVEPFDIDGHYVGAQNVPPRQRLNELENAGGDHQEQGSAQIQAKKSRGGLHG